jgi:glycosyltransferase
MLKVSIVTACWNSSSSIISAINSVNIQSYPNIEHVFIDGVSSDNTVDIIKSSSIRKNILISEKDKGIYDALNKGISVASGDIIGFVHSDDFLAHEEIIERVVNHFSNSYSPDIVYGDLQYVSKDNTDKVIRKWVAGDYCRDKFKDGWMPPHPTFFMKKSSYDKYGLFDLSYQISSDYESMIRYMWLNYQKVEYLPEVMVIMRTGGESNRSTERILLKMKEDFYIMRKYNFPALRTLFLKNFLKLTQFF